MNESIDASRRAARIRRIGLVCLTVGLLLGVGGMPTLALAYSAAHPAPLIGHAMREAVAPSHTNLSMNLTDRPQFQPQFVTVNVSSNLTILLHNTGLYNHSFTVSKVPNVILNRSWDPTQLDAFFAANGSLANVTVAPGTATSVNLSFNASSGLDSFEFVSIIPYQFQAGMSGFINVSGGPGLYLSDNTTNSLSFVPSVLEANISHFPAVLNVQITNPRPMVELHALAGELHHLLPNPSAPGQCSDPIDGRSERVGQLHDLERGGVPVYLYHSRALPGRHDGLSVHQYSTPGPTSTPE
jgi:hypothetical protein